MASPAGSTLYLHVDGVVPIAFRQAAAAAPSKVAFPASTSATGLSSQCIEPRQVSRSSNQPHATCRWQTTSRNRSSKSAADMGAACPFPPQADGSSATALARVSTSTRTRKGIRHGNVSSGHTRPPMVSDTTRARRARRPLAYNGGAMQRDGDGNVVFSATDLVDHLACGYKTELERAALAGKAKRPFRDDAGATELARAVAETEAAMRRGDAIIYQGVLVGGGFQSPAARPADEGRPPTGGGRLGAGPRARRRQDDRRRARRVSRAHVAAAPGLVCAGCDLLAGVVER